MLTRQRQPMTVFRDDEPEATQEMLDQVTADLLQVTANLSIKARRGTNGSITVRASFQDTHAETGISAVILRQWERSTAEYTSYQLAQAITETYFLRWER